MKEKKITGKNGAEYIIKEIGPEYAEAYLDFFKQVSGDTHYMSCYGDEIGTTEKDVENQRDQIRTLNADERQGRFSIFDGDKIVGNIAVRTAGKGRKTAHRCTFGLGIRKEYHGLGLGTVLIEEGLAFAKEAGYQLVELGVLSDNEPARGLYQKMGFQEWGHLPDAFHLDDGTVLEEVTMYRHV
jgi:RimJ/RimL family protein N-acetyltransferase